MEHCEKYYASIDAIKQLNNLESDYVSEGDRLLIVNLRVSDIVDIIMKIHVAECDMDFCYGYKIQAHQEEYKFYK